MNKSVFLKDVLEIQNGFAFDSALFNDNGNGMPIIRIRDLARGFSETYYNGDYDKRFIVKQNDLLIGMDGEFRCYLWQGKDALLNQRVCRLQNFSNEVNPKYIYYLINKYLVEIENNTAFVTVKHISSKQISEIYIPLPPLPEQERIVRLLDEAESLRATRERANVRMEQFIPALFQEMFGDFKEMTTLGNLVEEFRYGTSNKSNPNGYPTLRIPNVIGQKVDLDDLKYVPVNDEEFKRIQMNEGDILFVRSNGNPDNIGRSAVFESNLISEAGYEPEKFIYASYLIRARLKKEIVDPHYLQMYLSTNDGRKEVKKRARTSAGQYNINTENLSTIPVLLPPLALQREFAARVEAARGVQSAQGKSAERIEALYQSMLSRAFSGEL